MHLELSPELERLLHQKVNTGRYSSESEVVSQALRLLEEQDRSLDLRKTELREKIAEGFESLRRGEGVDGEAVFDRLEAELDAMADPKTG